MHSSVRRWELVEGARCYIPEAHAALPARRRRGDFPQHDVQAAPHQRTTIFAPPSFGFDLVPTLRTREILASGTVPKLMTVSAPAGYGKTAFLSQLYRAWKARGLNCIWISLDRTDAGSAGLLNLLEQVSELTGIADGWPGAAKPSADRLTKICHNFSSGKEIVLFVDNLQFCTDARLAAMLDQIAFTTGPQLKIVIASSAEIVFDRCQARLELGLVQVGYADLSFDPEDIRNIVRAAGLPEPSPHAVDIILQKSEGWPAAVRLMQLLLVEEHASERALKRFSGSDIDVAVTLRERLLAGLDAEMVGLLVDMSCLRVFSPDLAAAATANPRAADLIRRLVAGNALTFPLDRHGEWFRLHGLLREFLVAQGRKQSTPARRSVILERAALWCHENGHAEDAANYALTAPAPALAREIMDRNARDIVSHRGDLVTFLSWVGRARQLGMEIGAESEFWYAWALALARRPARAQELASKLQRRLEDMATDSRDVTELKRRISLLRVMLHVVDDDMKEAKQGAIEWLGSEKTLTPVYTMTAALAAATSMVPLQDYGEARRYIHIAQAASSHINGGYSHAWMAITKALLDLELGNPAAAEGVLVAAHTGAAERLGPHACMTAVLASLNARALCDLGRSDEARTILLASLVRSANQGFVDTLRHGLEAAVALGDGAESGPLGYAVLEALAGDGPPRLRRALAAAQIRRLCAVGEVRRALELGEQLGLDTDDDVEGCLPGEFLSIATARIDLLAANGRIKPGLKLAEAALRQATSLNRRREMVELQLTMARLHWLATDNVAAVRSVSRAIALAAPRSLAQPFLQHQRIFKEILQAARLKDLALTLSEQITFFGFICEKTGAHVGPATAAIDADAGRVDVLTHREIEMLTLLEAGPSNQQLADDLQVSVQTVKWHLYNAYAKLGVKNRAAALSKARALQILAH